MTENKRNTGENMWERVGDKKRKKIEKKLWQERKHLIITFISHGSVLNNKKMSIISNQMNKLSEFNLKVLGFNS